MKKKYIKPYFMVFKVHPVQIIAESFSIMEKNKTDSGNDLDGSSSGEQDNSAWSRDNIFDNNHSIWDNAW